MNIMACERSVEFSGDPKKVIDLAQSMFIQTGYKVTDISDSRISAEHIGGFTKSVSGNSVYGASPVTISISDNRLTVKASYEGIEKTKKYLLKLILGLALILGTGFGVGFGFVFEEKWPMVFGIVLGFGIPLIQLPIHLFVTPKIMKIRALRALDTFIENAIVLAG
jgi:hypothetical protein